ncbi:MAG: VOC family protein [Christensenellales bacterium]|jgi:uncharacterized glyoxalase superfamily protein PhnB
MGKYPQFTLSMSIGPTNRERLEAFALYQRAFGAKELSRSTPPNGNDIHIMMEIGGVEILLGPGKTVGTGFDNALNCELRFDREADFERAYRAISQQAQRHTIEGPYPWAERLGLVVDKFGIGWALYYDP